MRTLILACVFAAAATAPAFAEDAGIRIDLTDRDLSTPAAVARLHAQIERAAKRACEVDNHFSAVPLAYRLKCAAETIENTVVAANVPALTALHASLAQPVRS